MTGNPTVGLPALVVDADYVASHLSELVLCDVRTYLDGRSPVRAYEESHLPGALFVDLSTVLADSPDGERGRHPFPTPEDFAERLGRLGIADDSPVVCYDDSGGGTACRLVWMLHAIGQSAAILNGGMRAWKSSFEAGGSPVREPVIRTVRPWPESVKVDADELMTLSSSQVLFDVRSRAGYRGEGGEFIDVREGHIPGAVNLPWSELLDPMTGGFPTTEVLRAELDRLGVKDATDVTVSCGSGVRACALLVALANAGLGEGRLFVPSWSGWAASERPIATGP